MQLLAKIIYEKCLIIWPPSKVSKTQRESESGDTHEGKGSETKKKLLKREDNKRIGFNETEDDY